MTGTTVPSELTADQLAATAAAAFGHARPATTADEAEAMLPGWDAVGRWAESVVLQNADSDGDVPVADLVREAWAAFARGAGLDDPEWDALPPAARVGFEAAVRHVIGAAMCDPGDLDLDTTEPAWGPWAAARLGEEATRAS